MGVREQVLARLEDALAQCEADGLWSRDVRPAIALERPKQAEHGDLATNVAMTLARAAKKNPREIAQAIVNKLGASNNDSVIVAAELAGPGFINLRLANDVYFREVAVAYAQGETFGQTKTLAGEKVLVEFVSANPTGPMHVGHGRGAITGDIIARLLVAAGAEVHREYYVNDAGGQVAHLAHAVYVRAQQLEAAMHKDVIPEALSADDYQGEYVIDLARTLLEPMSVPERLDLVKSPFAGQRERLQRQTVELVMRTMIQPDLAIAGIGFDRYYSEAEMHASGRVEDAIKALEKKGLLETKVLPPPKGMEKPQNDDTFQSEQALLVMKTTEFGDDVDRPLKKPDGSYTYFAGDVAYHWDKLARGYTRLINVWGADHGGYVTRVRAAIAALGFDPKRFEVVLVQMVNLLRNGEPVKMGKRSGNFVTLRDVIEEAGSDATRVFFIERTGNSQFDFDLALAKKQEDVNPVFYVQYGHARAASILRKAAERGIAMPKVDLETLRGLVLPEEKDLLQKLLTFPDVVTGAAQALEPHRIVFFLKDIIGAFHSYLTRYKNTEKVLSDDAVKTQARLAMVMTLKQTLANALHLMGVSAPEQMSRVVEEPTV